MDLAQEYERKPIMVMPQRLGCPFCQFSVLAVDEVLIVVTTTTKAPPTNGAIFKNLIHS